METQPKSELQKYIFGEIFLISNKLQTIGDEFLGEVTTKQWFLIVIIGEFFKDSDPSLSELADKMGTSRQNIKQLALKLEKKGFIEINKDKNDSRILRLRITDSCKQYWANRSSKDEDFIEFIFKGMEVEELFQLLTSLDKFYKNIISFKIED